MKPNFNTKLKPVRRGNGLATFFLFCLFFSGLAFAIYYCLSPGDKAKLQHNLAELGDMFNHTKTAHKTSPHQLDASKVTDGELAMSGDLAHVATNKSSDWEQNAAGSYSEQVRLPGQKRVITVSDVIAKGDDYFVSRRFPQAFAEYKKALAMDTKDQDDEKIAYVHHQLGMLSIMTNSPKSAIDEFEMAAEIDPKSSQIQNNLGLTYQTVGEDMSAFNHFQKAFVLDPKSIDAAVNLSNSLCQHGNFAQAETVLQSSAHLNPASAKVHNNLGTVLCSQNKYLESMGEFEKAIAIDPAMASAHYGLGFSMMKVKSYMPAIKEFKQALSLNGQLSEATSKIQQAYRQATLANTASCN